MSLAERLTVLGGVASRAALLESGSRAELDDALRTGEVVRVARGRYALPAASHALVAAHRLSGVASHLSAALLLGWEVKAPPNRPHVTLPKNRKLIGGAGVVVHRTTLGADDVNGAVTSADRTLLDCLRSLPSDEGLAVADSALRHGFSHRRLVALAARAKGPGSTQVRRVAGRASELAANPFESVLRDIALDVPGLNVRPQVPVFGADFLGRPDLADGELKIVLEADSFEWHGGRTALQRDCRRYDNFVAAGWLVLRFAWEDVMFDRDWVRAVITAVTKERTDQRCCSCRAA